MDVLAWTSAGRAIRPVNTRRRSSPASARGAGVTRSVWYSSRVSLESELVLSWLRQPPPTHSATVAAQSGALCAHAEATEECNNGLAYS
eukprot:scaffold1983_cov376-Prasinococcus_capsulatus_cf.AAC.12